MSPFIACLYMASAASLSIGVLAGVAWWRRRDLRHYGLFSLLALAAGLMSLMEPGFYQASTAEAYARWLWWNVTFAIVFLASFAWFLVSYTRVARRRLAWIITAILGVDGQCTQKQAQPQHAADPAEPRPAGFDPRY